MVCSHTAAVGSGSRRIDARYHADRAVHCAHSSRLSFLVPEIRMSSFPRRYCRLKIYLHIATVESGSRHIDDRNLADLPVHCAHTSRLSLLVRRYGTADSSGYRERTEMHDLADLLVPRSYSSCLSAHVRHGAPHMLALLSLSIFGCRNGIEMLRRPGPC